MLKGFRYPETMLNMVSGYLLPSPGALVSASVRALVSSEQISRGFRV